MCPLVLAEHDSISLAWTSLDKLRGQAHCCGCDASGDASGDGACEKTGGGTEDVEFRKVETGFTRSGPQL